MAKKKRKIKKNKSIDERPNIEINPTGRGQTEGGSYGPAVELVARHTQ